MNKISSGAGRIVRQQSSNRMIHYHIDYEHMRGVSRRDATPNTVRANVKNVVGWRGGAERGFLAAYPDCIHVLANNSPSDNLSKYYRKVLTYNLSAPALQEKRYGMLVPIAYRQIRRSASNDEMTLAHILGWCVELANASAILSANGTASGTTFNDASLIENGIFILLKHFFGSDWAAFYQHFMAAHTARTFGRTLSVSLRRSANANHNSARLDGYSIGNYKVLVRSEVSATNFCLPVSLALELAGLDDVKIHEKAHNILHEIGYHGELSNNFDNCYLTNDGGDIEAGRLTWLIVLAMQRADSQQLAMLRDNYGCNDDASVQRVKSVYSELKLKKMLRSHMEEKKVDILNRIQGISKLDKAGLSQQLFFVLADKIFVS